ncbi:MAG: HEAT repeat domain-containing protein [Armatimonadota bacterium]
MKKTKTKDPRTTDELFKLAVSTEDDDEFNKAVYILWDRHDNEVIDTAYHFCHSKVAQERAVGAYVLSGNTKEGVRSGATSINQIPDIIAFLSDMLDDEDSEVLRAAVFGLGTLDPSFGYMDEEGYRNDVKVRQGLVKSIPGILRLADHPDSYVRKAVAHALGSMDDSLRSSKRLQHSAESVLLKLASDENTDVREEVFVNLTSIEEWSPEIRQMLYDHLNDEDESVRGVILYEFAERDEPGTVELLIREISTHTDINEIFILEAATKLADSRLLPVLQKLQEQGVNPFQSLLDNAIEACSGSKQEL